MASVEKWLVEVTEPSGTVRFSQEFVDHAEADSSYNTLKESYPNCLVSIQKTDKRLLLEG